VCPARCSLTRRGIDASWQQGYSPWTTIAHLHLMAHLSRWLSDQQLTPTELNAARVTTFLTDRRASGQSGG
jgi:hypothetical protein